MSHLDDLDEYEAELEVALKKEYQAVFALFRFCVLTQDATYLCNRLDVLLALGRPVLVGFSRKSSLRRLTGSDDLLGASVAAAVAAFERGATILRVHDVKPHVDALTVAGAIA